jgi:hypothetical protein
MERQNFRAPQGPVMTDPEWIALESLDERTKHFIFDDAMLLVLTQRGLVEPKEGQWRVTPHGQQALNERSAY